MLVARLAITSTQILEILGETNWWNRLVGLDFHIRRRMELIAALPTNGLFLTSGFDYFQEARRLLHAGGVVPEQLRLGLMAISRVPLDVEVNASPGNPAMIVGAKESYDKIILSMGFLQDIAWYFGGRQDDGRPPAKVVELSPHDFAVQRQSSALALLADVALVLLNWNIPAVGVNSNRARFATDQFAAFHADVAPQHIDVCIRLGDVVSRTDDMGGIQHLCAGWNAERVLVIGGRTANALGQFGAAQLLELAAGIVRDACVAHVPWAPGREFTAVRLRPILAAARVEPLATQRLATCQ